MTKDEVVETCNKVYARIDEFIGEFTSLLDELRNLRNTAEDLPSEIVNIDDSVKEDE